MIAYLILPALLAAGAVGYVIWTRKKARTDAEVAAMLARNPTTTSGGGGGPKEPA